MENVERLSGGGSNASYSFWLRQGDDLKNLVLRVKQPGTIETYVPREYQMLQALHGAFPVPEPFWIAEDSRYFGAPALICGFVPGVQAPPTDVIMATGMGVTYGETLRSKLAPQFVTSKHGCIRTIGLCVI